MSLPRIAVSTGIQEDAGRHRRPAALVYTSYLDALAQAGMAPIAITPAHAPEAIAAILAVCDGLLLTGGGDVHPARYGEAPAPGLGPVSVARDELEWRALDLAFARELPVLGICRGCQVLNVYLGGTLHQDLESQVGAHVQSESWSEAVHDVAIRSDSLLHRCVGTTRLRSNSFHHQAVKALAAPLRAVAHAEDGIIEAVESAEHRWVLAVQWHPERRAASQPADHPDRRLFEAFGAAVARHVA